MPLQPSGTGAGEEPRDWLFATAGSAPVRPAEEQPVHTAVIRIPAAAIAINLFIRLIIQPF